MRKDLMTIFVAAAGIALAGVSPPHPLAVGGATLPVTAELTALQSNCQICHSFDLVYTQRLSAGAWKAEVAKMVTFGSPLPKSSQAAVVGYLTRYLGPGVPRTILLRRVPAPPITFAGPP